VTTTEPGRHLALDGSFNFRDIGGYRTTDGLTTRWRRVFRADGPHDLTEADAAVLGELGITTILDLRTVDESAERGQWTAHVGNATYHHLPMTDVLPDEVELGTWTDPVRVGEHYVDLTVRGAGAISAAIRTLADDAALPAMFHCSAGKDRTGVLAALLLGFLGVPDETIVADYALSRDAMRRMLTWLEGRVPDRSQLDKYAPAIQAAEPESMSVFLTRLRERYDSFDGVARSLGVERAVVDLRNALLT
jgi:protein-tyrosine phosphatase